MSANKNEFDVEAAKLGDFSLGKLEIKSTPEFQRIVSEAAGNALVQDYIVCKAIARAGVHRDAEMVDYFTRMTNFFAGKPTPEQQITWQNANPFPKKRGRLEISGPMFVEAQKNWVFEFDETTPQRVMGVLNAGDEALTWWYKYFPTDYFYTDVHVGDKTTLKPKDSISVDLILKGANPKNKRHHFKIRADSGEEVVVFMEITGSPYKLLADELNKRLLSGSGGFTNLTNQDLVTERATEIVDEKFKDASSSSKQFLVSQVMLSAQFPYSAFTSIQIGTGTVTPTPEARDLLQKRLKQIAEIDEGIQHIKWAVKSEKEGNAEAVTLHTEKAYEAVKANYDASAKTILILKEAKEDAQNGNIHRSVLKARGTIDDLVELGTIKPADPVWSQNDVPIATVPVSDK